VAAVLGTSAASLGYLSESVVFRFFGQQGLQREYLFTLLSADGNTVGDGVSVHLLHGVGIQMLQGPA
jgi:hypothetical protein